MTTLPDEIAKRRTFAIISHPDAGKTTLTEKLLLFGGAIQMAGSVKGRKSDRHATSDWMALEQQRGISVTSSVMQFPYRGRIINLLDTPGHADFSEDTYLTDVPMGGKTGTGQAGLTKDDHALFTAYAPYGDPNLDNVIAVTVVVEHGGHGSSAAAPVAAKLIDFYFKDIMGMSFKKKQTGK